MRRSRVIRRRVFLGCQGESERSYATLLHKLVERTHGLHIDAVLLNRGGWRIWATDKWDFCLTRAKMAVEQER